MIIQRGKFFLILQRVHCSFQTVIFFGVGAGAGKNYRNFGYFDCNLNFFLGGGGWGEGSKNTSKILVTLITFLDDSGQAQGDN